jgi:hypothetical protein
MWRGGNPRSQRANLQTHVGTKVSF